METENFVDMTWNKNQGTQQIAGRMGLFPFFNKAFVRFQRVAFGVCILWGDLVIMFHQKEPAWLSGKLRKQVVVKPFA